MKDGHGRAGSRDGSSDHIGFSGELELATLRRAAYGAAYRMLGVHADAEDAAQESVLRLQGESPPPRNPRGWIVAVATHLCIDRLRSAQVRREAYVGPWLPEPLLRGPDPSEQLELAESVSLALLIVLERLSAAERAAFLLHDVFGYDYGEISRTLARTPAAARQLVSRARRAVREERVRFEPDPDRRAAVAEAFARACIEGELDALLALLSEDVVMRADGGGVAQASRKPLVGSARVARAVLALRQAAVRRQGEAPFAIRLLPVNGTPGMLISERGRPSTLMGVDVAAERVVAIHVLREPRKLAAALATLD